MRAGHEIDDFTTRDAVATQEIGRRAACFDFIESRGAELLGFLLVFVSALVRNARMGRLARLSRQENECAICEVGVGFIDCGLILVSFSGNCRQYREFVWLGSLGGLSCLAEGLEFGRVV